jgi:chlorite dismutase
MTTRAFTFAGRAEGGSYRVVRMETVTGEPVLSKVTRLSVWSGHTIHSDKANWLLRGMVSNERYVTRTEKTELVSHSPTLGRPEATSAALIPIRKNAEWWAMTQDERRNVFEEQSHHIRIGLRRLPAVARRLHHCRDLGTDEPFDFLTWFEYAPADEAAFDAMVAELRQTPEWKYVDREVDIRLVREKPEV